MCNVSLLRADILLKDSWFNRVIQEYLFEQRWFIRFYSINLATLFNINMGIYDRKKKIQNKSEYCLMFETWIERLELINANFEVWSFFNCICLLNVVTVDFIKEIIILNVCSNICWELAILRQETNKMCCLGSFLGKISDFREETSIK